MVHCLTVNRDIPYVLYAYNSVARIQHGNVTLRQCTNVVHWLRATNLLIYKGKHLLTDWSHEKGARRRDRII
jgi:hypothetical protein